MIKRTISEKVIKYAKQYPVLTITGPRQSGKTTLCRMLFKDKEYISLEDIDKRNFARNDPRGFLEGIPDGAIIDEIQRVPELLSYIQTIVDEKQKEGMFILTGSQQFELLENISQSLAGRTALVRLLPFSYTEAYGKRKKSLSLDKVLFTGFYPRIFDKKLHPTEAMSFYISTYIERDVRMLINIKDFSRFEVFLKLCAGRTGQILNLSSLGSDCGVNYGTIKSWISVLEASYIIKLLRPYYKNFNKRLVKSPKLYFLDTGLASYLLDIQNEIQMKTHPLKGALFESFIVSELLKTRYNMGKTDNLYYFRDNTGNEIDVISDHGINIDLIEIKSGQTITSDYFRGLKFFSSLSNDVRNSSLVYGGNESYKRQGVDVYSWKEADKIV